MTLIGLSVLLYSTLGMEGPEADITFIQKEGEALGEQLGPWFEYFFYFAGFVILFSTNVGIMD